MSKKARSNHHSRRHHEDNNIIAIHNDQQARLAGPKKKSWSIHDLKSIRPLTDTQSDMFQSWFQGDNICAAGSAGVGKSFLAFYLSLNEMLSRGEHDKIIVVRSVVAGREMGHLPGSKEEKEEVFELPYHDICHELLGRKSTYNDMKEAGKIKFVSTSHIRGLTWDNALVIVDESQNMNFDELDSVMTRIGENTRVIICGDHKRQCDLKRHEVSGLDRLIDAFDYMDNFSNIKFTADDVVRSKLVKQWLKATDQV